MSGVSKPHREKLSGEISKRDIIEFMKKNPPKTYLTSYEIDQALIENAKTLLVYQAEISIKDPKEGLNTRYFKYCKFVVTQ